MKKLWIICCLLLVMIWAGPVMALDITFQWDANTESDLAGYKLYYKIASEGGPPYDGVDAIEGFSPIDVGNVTEITIHGFPGADELSEGMRIFVAITAYNILLMESGFSNEVDVGVPTQPGNLRIKSPSSE